MSSTLLFVEAFKLWPEARATGLVVRSAIAAVNRIDITHLKDFPSGSPGGEESSMLPGLILLLRWRLEVFSILSCAEQMSETDDIKVLRM